MKVWKELSRSVLFLLIFMVVTGLMYPFLMIGVGKLAFPKQVAGSLIYDQKGQVTGSALIGENVTSPRYFSGRPSSTSPPDSSLASTGSNLGPTNPQLVSNIDSRILALQKANPAAKGPIPVVLVMSSASGIDPDISIAAADYQAPRIAKAWHRPLSEVLALINAHTLPRQFGFMGEARLNVVALNQALDQIYGKRVH